MKNKNESVYLGNFIDMHPKELSEKINKFINSKSDEKSKMVSFDIKMKFIDKDFKPHELETKLNANRR